MLKKYKILYVDNNGMYREYGEDDSPYKVLTHGNAPIPLFCHSETGCFCFSTKFKVEFPYVLTNEKHVLICSEMYHERNFSDL